MDPQQQSAPAALQTARASLARGDAGEAERIILEELRHSVGSRDLFVLLAAVSQQLEKPLNAVLALEEAIGLEPDDPSLWMTLGSIQGKRFHWVEAARAYEQAVMLAPRDPHTLVALGIAQLATQRVNAAMLTRNKLMADFANEPGTYLLAGSICKALGEVEAARDAYSRALQLAPHCTEALFNLVDIKPPAPDDPLRKEVAATATRGDLGEAERANVEFAMARIHERDGEFQAAFHLLRSANARQESALRTNGVFYDRQRSDARAAQIIERYPASAFSNRLPPAAIDLTPIFIVGMPRSGTSLVEQILASHPQVCGGGELAAAQLCEERYLSEHGRRGLSWPPRPAAADEARLLMEMRERYLEHLFESDLDGDYVTDKLPGNFMSLGFIRMMFPNAVIVHCSRDPVATGSSLFAANLGGHSPAYTSLENIAHAYGLYRRLISHWRKVLQPAMVEVRYEALVSDPDAGIQQLLSSCGLAWDRRCLQFHSRSGAVTTASALQVRRPVYSTSLEKWRVYEPYLQPLAALRDASPI